MSAQHTPGPWELIHFGGPQIGHKATGEAVCTMWGDENDPADQFHANARLIAAAPQLYEALIAVLEGVHGARADEDLDCSTDAGGYLLGDVMNDALIAADKALAKARGEA